MESGRNGVIDSATSGYHETVTVAWARVVSAALEKDGPFASFAELAQANPHLLAKTLLYSYYSRERLGSAAARAGFLEPDLAPLP